MKVQYLLFSILILFTSILSAQTNFEWEQIEQPEESLLQVVFINSAGEIYGYNQKEFILYISRDEGTSWDVLFYDESKYFLLEPKQMKEYEGKVYIGISDVVYEHTIDTDVIKQVIEVEEYRRIRALTVLRNGHIVLSDDNALHLYNEDFELIATGDINVSNLDFIVAGENVNYLVKSRSGRINSLIEFNHDLTRASNGLEIPDFNNFFERDRVLFSESGYSTDKGITWINFSFEPEIIANDEMGDIYAVKDLVVFRSEDEGTTWNVIDTFPSNDDYWADQRTLVASNNKLLSADRRCGSRIATIYNGLNDELNTINTKTGRYYSWNVVAGKNENIFTSMDCTSDFSHMKLDEDEPWQALEKTDFRTVLELNHLTSLPNDSWIGLAGHGMVALISEDKGDSWNTLNVNIYPDKLSLKNDVIYLYGNRDITYSADNGINWDTIAFDDYYSWKTITANHEAIYSQNIDHVNSYYITDLTDNTTRELKYNGKEIGEHIIASSYTGSNIYSLSYYESSFFLRSIDGGHTFEELNIPFDISTYYRILVDHNNYIYLHNGHQILFSSDEGDTWHDISPVSHEVYLINSLNVSQDNYVYIGTKGAGILKAEVGVINSNIEFEVADISVHPNPATTNITFNLNQNASNGNWIIHDISGRMIKAGNISGRKIEVDLAQMKQGLYFIEFVTDNYQASTRFVKM